MNRLPVVADCIDQHMLEKLVHLFVHQNLVHLLVCRRIQRDHTMGKKKNFYEKQILNNKIFLSY